MLNTTSKPPKMGNIPLAAVQQWIEADAENTPESWGYVSGLLSGILIFRPDISEELMFLHQIATQRGLMASQATGGKYSLLTPKERIDALSDTLSRMKAHSVILSQFFTRPATKQAAISGMNAEVENMLVLWEKIKADVEEMEVQQ
ncbi:hypothetical protein [Thiothrix fructosivorans]|uniref:Uncharacterized protein n=1 Tax=Thiothrix fructosivorans TaxID=111770 RepID=A0A8B0SIP9_9GAMM|nr:hypothetical protein [Thiothrix fructosivorans]MBO0613692.1 hypothetical protein [Thiothrix fructosivorans]QTX10894.1 hypothetical protein J1836_000500 [Thiothrix fructosivorans]